MGEKFVSQYFNASFERSFTSDQLREANPEIQREVMETWFRHNFEDPAERTPYESAEGGYIWIWGGPYEAREELEEEFSGIVGQEVIDELVDELENECFEWAPTPSPDDYDQLALDISQISDYYQTFSSSILDIQALLNSSVADAVRPCLNRLLFVNVVTALETYLSDAFINTVMNDQALMRRFVETLPEFQKQKIPLSEVLDAAKGISRKARAYLIDVVWHHVERVRPMYKDTLKIDFPDLGAIGRAIGTRHDIVHRNGKTKDGQEITVSVADVLNLIKSVEDFVQSIDTQLGARSTESAPKEVIDFDDISEF